MPTNSILATLGWLSLFVAVTAATSADLPDPLRPYRWKNRILVLHVPDQPGAKQILDSWEAALRQEKGGLVDRDLLVLHAGPRPGKTPGYAEPLTGAQKAALRQRLQLAGPEPQVVLIGKDGGVKRRQSGDRLDLPALFALIDTMPMRREEMRRDR